MRSLLPPNATNKGRNQQWQFHTYQELDFRDHYCSLLASRTQPAPKISMPFTTCTVQGLGHVTVSELQARLGISVLSTSLART